MLIGVHETPAIAPRVLQVEVNGEPVVYSFRAMLGPAGWCNHYAVGTEDKGGIRIVRDHHGVPYEFQTVGPTRAWIYGEEMAVELTPEIVTLEWEIDNEAVAKVEAAYRQRGGA